MNSGIMTGSMDGMEQGAPSIAIDFTQSSNSVEKPDFNQQFKDLAEEERLIELEIEVIGRDVNRLNIDIALDISRKDVEFKVRNNELRLRNDNVRNKVIRFRHKRKIVQDAYLLQVGWYI